MAPREKTRRRGRTETTRGPLRKVTAIIRVAALEQVSKRLQELHVPGISVTKVKGYGEYMDFFRSNWMVEHARIELFLPRERADEVARAIVEVAQTGGPGDGLVAILPVESLYQIRSGALATSDELGGCTCASKKTETTPHPKERHASAPR